MQGKIDVQLTTQDMNSVMLTAGQRRTKKARPKAGFPFDIDVCIHAFPPPSPPQNLQLISHNNLSVRVAWDSPASWGGCALSHFELQMRKVTVKGDLKEWIPGEWRSGLEGCIFENVHVGALRLEHTLHLECVVQLDGVALPARARRPREPLGHADVRRKRMCACARSISARSCRALGAKPST